MADKKIPARKPFYCPFVVVVIEVQGEAGGITTKLNCHIYSLNSII